MIYKISSDSEVLDEFLDILERFNSKTGMDIGGVLKVASVPISQLMRTLLKNTSLVDDVGRFGFQMDNLSKLSSAAGRTLSVTRFPLRKTMRSC